MLPSNPFRLLARDAPAPVDALLELWGGVAEDTVDLLTDPLGQGNDLEAWDPEHIERTLPPLRALSQVWFRPDVRGLERIPDGPSLIVGNHSGGLYIADTFVFAQEFYAHFGPYRRFHQLAHDLAARQPLLGILRRYGTLAADHDNARRAFEAGAPVLVYPGGDHETFRPSWQSDRVDFGGRKGFIRLALEAGVPIVPLVAIGGQETALFVTRGRRAARALGLDRIARVKVLPVSIGPPFGINLLDLPGRLPLPAKITLEVLPPVDLRDRFGRDPDVDDVYDELTGDMQETLEELADERILPIVG